MHIRFYGALSLKKSNEMSCINIITFEGLADGLDHS